MCQIGKPSICLQDALPYAVLSTTVQLIVDSRTATLPNGGGLGQVRLI